MAGRRGRGAAARKERERDRTARVADPEPARGPGAAFAEAQRTAGNAAVQRLVAGDLPIQRYELGLAATASCDELLAHLRTKGKYRPEAAHTKVVFTWSGNPTLTKAGRKYQATFPDAEVGRTTDVDMPEWEPTGPMAVRWARAKRELRDHEAEHEQRGEEWEKKIAERLQAMSVTVSSPTAARAEAEKIFQRARKEHDAAQRLLDPYDVVIECP